MKGIETFKIRKELSANFHLIPMALVYNLGFQTRELRKWPMFTTDNQKELLKAGINILNPEGGYKWREVQFTEDGISAQMGLLLPAWFRKLDKI